MINKKILSILSISIFFTIISISGCGVQNVDPPASGAGSSGAQLVAIQVTPTNPTVAKNTSQQFTATGIYANNTTKDLTATVTWSLSDSNVASINYVAGTSTGTTAAALNSGGGHAYAYGKTTGKTTVTATSGSTSGSTTLTVTNATLVSIAVTPASPSIAKGTTQQLIATGTFSDNTTQDLSTQATWNSSNTSAATISSSGLATAVGAGSTLVSATMGGIAGSDALTVTPATLLSISVTPTNPSMAKGTALQFAATGIYSDNTTQNLTTSVSWSSSSTGVATINASGLSVSAATGVTTISATLGTISGSTTLTVTQATLSSISITPVNPSNAKGTTRQFTATGTYSDGTTQNLTASVTWGSANTTVATVSNAAGSKGVASCLAAGTSTISATLGTISSSTTLTVTQATLLSISVTPANPSIASGTVQQFAATGTYTDGTTQVLTAAVTWNTSNAAVATISNAAGSNGLATSVAAGTATITATTGGVSGTASLTVTASTKKAVVSWTAPTVNIDGTPLLDLAGYKIYYGTSSGNYTTILNVGNVTTYTISNLTPGTYYFAVTAYDTQNLESTYSNEVSGTI